MLKFTKEVEQNTPKFKEIYTGLAQPIEDKTIHIKDKKTKATLPYSITLINKENIFQIINQETGETEKEFYGSVNKKIYKKIKSYKKRTNNIGIIGHIELGNPNTAKILSKHLLKGIPAHKITTDSSGNKMYQAVTRKSELYLIKQKKTKNSTPEDLFGPLAKEKYKKSKQN